MPDISLLPEDMRGKEEEVRTGKPAEKPQVGGLKMHVPEAAADEDIEIIEVDEGDLATILSDEPLMTRFTYKISATIDKLKDKLTGKKKEAEAPPKLPPQFFKPPKAGLVTKPPQPPGVAKPGEKGEGAVPGKPKASITPQADVPRRVRVIKRVKKPVRVSLISAEDLAKLSIDVGKRKWTLAVVSFLFIAVLAFGYYLISERLSDSRQRLADAREQLDETRVLIDEKQSQWSQYEDLQERLTLLDTVLNKHIVISRMFDFLELRTIPSVSYRTAGWTDDGQLILDAIAKSYDSAARQLIAFEQSETVESMDATSFSWQQSGETDTGVSFQLILKLDADSLRGPLLVQETEDTESIIESATSTALAP